MTTLSESSSANVLQNIIDNENDIVKPPFPVSSPVSSPLKISKSKSTMEMPSSPPELTDEIDEQENDVNENENDTQNKENNSPYSLGFTTKLLSRIEQSKTKLNTYIKQQRKSTIDTMNTMQKVQQLEKEDIKHQILELKHIQYKRGVLVDIDGTGNGNDDGDGTADGTSNNNSTNSGNGGLAQQQQTLKEKLVEIERELANCQLEHKQVDKNVKVVKEIEEHEYAKAEEVRKAKERIENSKKVTVDDLTLAVLKYQMLGINFVKGNDLRLQCEFTQIDEVCPEQTFTFVLNVNEEDEYEVEDCNPFLNASIVLKLVQDLNETSLWSDFIVGMREAFKESLVL
jgi:hypothetical protein